MWVLRVVSLAGLIASFFAIGGYVRKADTHSASLLVFGAVACAILLAWSWAASLVSLFDRAKRYVQGVEGDHPHEWYAFKGQRVRVFLDVEGQPWFALDEVAHILDLKIDRYTFRHYGSRELGVPTPGAGQCLSESGLRRLIRYSTHPDARALGLWLEREVLRMLAKRAGRTPG